MKTIDLSIDVENIDEAGAIQPIAERAMIAIDSFYIALGREPSVSAVKVIDMLESLRDQAEIIEDDMYEEDQT